MKEIKVKSFEKFFQKETLDKLKKNRINSFDDFEKIFEKDARKILGHDAVRRLTSFGIEFKKKEKIDYLLLNFENFSLKNSQKKQLNDRELFYIFDLINISRSELLKIVSNITISRFEQAGAKFRLEDSGCSYENLLSNYNRFFLKKSDVCKFASKEIYYLDDFVKITEKEALEVVGTKMIARLKKEGAVFLAKDERQCFLYKELFIKSKNSKQLNMLGIYNKSDFKNFTELEVERVTGWRFIEWIRKKNIEFRIDENEKYILNYKNFYISPHVRRELYKDGYFTIQDLARISLDEASKYFAKKMLNRIIKAGATFASSKVCTLQKELNIMKKYCSILNQMDIYCIDDFKKYYRYEIYGKFSMRMIKTWERKGVVFKEGIRFDWGKCGINILTTQKLDKLHIFAPKDLEKFAQEEIISKLSIEVFNKFKNLGFKFIDSCIDNKLSDFKRFGINKEKQKRLKELGIVTLDDFSKINQHKVKQLFGIQFLRAIKKKGAAFANDDCLDNFSKFHLQKFILDKLYAVNIETKDDFEKLSEEEAFELVGKKVFRRLKSIGFTFNDKIAS